MRKDSREGKRESFAKKNVHGVKSDKGYNRQ